MRATAASLGLLLAGCYASTRPATDTGPAPDGFVRARVDASVLLTADSGPPVVPPPTDPSCGGAIRLSPDGGFLSTLGELALTRDGEGRVIFDTCGTGGCFAYINRYEPVGGTWSSADRVDTTDLGGTEATRVAISSTGHTIAAWTRVVGAQRSVFAARQQPGAAFEAPIAVSDPCCIGAWPEVVVDASGGALAAWHQPPSVDSVATRVLFGAGAITGPSVAGAGIGGALFGRLAIDDRGDSSLAWSEAGAAWARVGVGLNALANVPVRLGDLATASRESGRAVGNAAGGSGRTVVWIGAEEGVHAVSSTSDGWGAAQRIDAPGGGAATIADIALASDGTGIAAWAARDATGTSIWAAVFDPATGWQQAERLGPPAPPGPLADAHVATAATAGGAFVVAATPAAGGPILVARGSAGVIGDATPTGRVGRGVQVALDGRGRAVLVWEAWTVMMSSVICTENL